MGVNDLDSLITRLSGLPAAGHARVKNEVLENTRHLKWVPNPGPQTEAYFSKADVLLFGGEPGGGKTELGLGLAFNCHRRSLFLRRQYTDLGGAIDAAIRINGSRDGYSGQPPPRLTLESDRFIDFGAAVRLGDEQHWMGKPHDLIVPDESTQFAYQQIRFLMGWLRHEDPGQRTRVVLPTNPPLTAEGLWVIEMFAPWLDDHFPDPAKPGELRWVVTDEDGKDRWVDGPAAIEIGGKMVRPLSRTFIPSSMDHNPYYAAGSYRSQLDAMIEPFRSILMGGFKTSFQDAPNQVIPTAWIKAAQERWTEKPPAGVPMCAMAADASGGGRDPLVICWRFDGWYAPVIEVPGKEIPVERIGAYSAGIVISHRRDMALVVVDLGGGYGSSMFEHLHANAVEAVGYKGAEESTGRTRDGRLKFANRRSEVIWRFREALDPGQPGGSPIMLPDDPVLVADLSAPTLDLEYNGIRVESKEAVCKRLGRSTDHGDAVVMAWSTGPKQINSALEWADQREALRMRLPYGKRPQVVSGRENSPISRRAR